MTSPAPFTVTRRNRDDAAGTEDRVTTESLNQKSFPQASKQTSAGAPCLDVLPCLVSYPRARIRPELDAVGSGFPFPSKTPSTASPQNVDISAFRRCLCPSSSFQISSSYVLFCISNRPRPTIQTAISEKRIGKGNISAEELFLLA
ncbi:hypothetical protein HPP92_019397 [Vanilla planifolia]|uniref:Uncharacterized protein n=1 Tax=Vanilla planifolia TaxID=51239 RepID=A0A835ULJ2_VANPL|nr:hypothetical protein HPP92_019880 [Vanilla planifolia]KAG0465233.1 hypothetical protein HPP92_019397 [Vanilla planifolia]